MANSLDYSDEELIQQLRMLNYEDISQESIEKFKEELFDLANQYSLSSISTPNTKQSISPSFLEDTNANANSLPVNFEALDLENESNDSRDKSNLNLPFDVPASKMVNAEIYKQKKPLVRKTVKRINGKSVIFVEKKSGADVNAKFENKSSVNSFISLSPDASKISSTDSPNVSIYSNYSSKMDCEIFDKEEASKSSHVSLNSLSKASDGNSERHKLGNLSRSSIVSIEKIPRSMFDSSFLSSSETSTLTDSLLGSEMSSRSRNSELPHRLKRSHSYDDVRTVKYPTKSFIRPASCNANSRKNRKSDPVQKYHEYKQFWEAFKVPGEKSHKQLRWMVREHMMSDPSNKERNFMWHHRSAEKLNSFPLPWRN